MNLQRPPSASTIVYKRSGPRRGRGERRPANRHDDERGSGQGGKRPRAVRPTRCDRVLSATMRFFAGPTLLVIDDIACEPTIC